MTERRFGCEEARTSGLEPSGVRPLQWRKQQRVPLLWLLGVYRQSRARSKPHEQKRPAHLQAPPFSCLHLDLSLTAATRMGIVQEFPNYTMDLFGPAVRTRAVLWHCHGYCCRIKAYVPSSLGFQYTCALEVGNNSRTMESVLRCSADEHVLADCLGNWGKAGRSSHYLF